LPPAILVFVTKEIGALMSHPTPVIPRGHDNKSLLLLTIVLTSALPILAR
jgi:hypothetical protein